MLSWSIQIDQFEFKRVEYFKYLHTILDEENDVAIDVAPRI